MHGTVLDSRAAALFEIWGRLVDVKPRRAGVLSGDTAAALDAAQAAVWEAFRLVTRDAAAAAAGAAVSSELPVDLWPVDVVAA